MTVSFAGSPSAPLSEDEMIEVLKAASIPAKGKAAPKVNSPSLFLITMYVTTYSEDIPSEYVSYSSRTTQYASERADYFTALYNDAKGLMETETIKGYAIRTIQVWPLQPEIPVKLLMSGCAHDYKVVKKTFLNGPKKDNEFLKKKGKHYV